MWAFAWQNLITRPSRTALAVVGLTIPILAFLGLFSISRGIRDLVGGTLGKMQGLLVLRENSPSPVFSDLPADMAKTLRAIPGVRVVAPEVWKIAPPIDGKGGLGAAAIGLLTRPRESGMKNLAKMVVIEGQDLPEHLKLKSAVFAMSLLPKERGGGRFLDLGDIGQHNVVISTKIARDYPNADGTPKTVGQTIRIGTEDFTIVGLYETGSLVTDVTIVMEIGVARRLLGVADEAVSTFAVEPFQIADTDALADRIEAALPGVTAQRISQFSLTVGGIMGKLDLFLLAAVGLALLVGGVGIANTMLMSTYERFVEFGVMRSNGWTQAEHPRPDRDRERAAGPPVRRDRCRGGGRRGARREPLPDRLRARTEALARRGQPGRRGGGRGPLRTLPRLEGLDDDADGRHPPRRDD